MVRFPEKGKKGEDIQFDIPEKEYDTEGRGGQYLSQVTAASGIQV